MIVKIIILKINTNRIELRIRTSSMVKRNINIGRRRTKEKIDLFYLSRIIFLVLTKYRVWI